MVLADRILRGRDSEIAVLDDLLRAARAGRSGVLVFRGDAGIGKTALLEYAAGEAEDFLVLRARGVQPESHFPFAGLQELFGSVVGLLDTLPERQRTVLAGALALGPPVRGDRLATCAATLSLLAAVAEDGPVLAVIDDAHWLDSASAEALAFTARRLHSEGVVVLMAMRAAEPSAFDPTGLPMVDVVGLAENYAREVLVDLVGGGAAPAVVRAVAATADGNPLALRELARMLSAAQLSGREPLGEPLLVSRDLERAFARRLEPLSEDTRVALLIAAAGAQDEPRTVIEAVWARGVSFTAFEEAEHAGLITITDGLVRFYHPLLRSVIYQAAPGDQRRAAHTALAAALEGSAADRRAWHLAAASLGPDEHVAAALDEAAGRAAARGGLSTAAHAYARAAGLSASTDARCQRLLAAGNLAFTSGRPEWAATLAEEGLPLAEAAGLRADFEHLAATAERARGSASRARTLLSAAATRVAGEDPARAVTMFLDAAVTDGLRGDLRAAAASARRATEMVGGCSPALQSYVDLVNAMVAGLSGTATEAEYESAGTRAAGFSTSELPAPAAGAVEMILATGRSLFEPVEGGKAVGVDALITAARQRGALSELPYLLGMAAGIDRREGAWTRAWARATEAAELAGDTGQWIFRGWALMHMARIEAARGIEPDCREHSTAALALAQQYDLGLLEIHLCSVAGLLELSLGNIPQAVAQLERCARLAAEAHLGYPPTVPYQPDLVEALWACGRDQDARAAASMLDEHAHRSQSPWALATSRRCHGLLAAEDDLEVEFQAALALHDRVPSAFERARTELCYGERLRRGRQRADSRQHLESALAVFEQYGAKPWAERARRELHATGAAARPRRDPAAIDRLTAQELRVALMIADGATIRQAAAELVLSPKTIEAHLGRVYRKLGVHNRAQLVTTLSSRTIA
jgi:DNA-binding CsgD family transcriptional regulator